LPDSLKAIAYRNAAEVDTGRDFHQHMERLIRSMDRLPATTPQSRAGESKERDSTADAASGPAPAVARPTAAASVRVPEVAGTAEPQNIARAKKGKPRPYPALWIGALCVLLIAGLGTGAWLYLRHKDDVASAPTVAPTPTITTTARPQSASNTRTVGNYQIDKLSSISGPPLVTGYIADFDASRPDSGVETCARRCDATQGCKAFDVSLVYSKCSLYGAADRTVLMGGYISGIKR
jgi:hypothetical protein